jgi:hypothetical protein
MLFVRVTGVAMSPDGERLSSRGEIAETMPGIGRRPYEKSVYYRDNQ